MNLTYGQATKADIDELIKLRIAYIKDDFGSMSYRLLVELREKMLGLKRGTVELVPHQKEWDESAEKVIAILKDILGKNAVDIQHVGSTAIPSIKAKPIVDIAVGMRDLNTAALFDEKLKAQGIIFRGEDHPGQRLYVMGDFENNTRTHHIHFIEWKGIAWKNYLAFRDYLNVNPDKARLYENCKMELAEKFQNDRNKYTDGKQELIDRLLEEVACFNGFGRDDK